jgi:hypothetical protein
MFGRKPLLAGIRVVAHLWVAKTPQAVENVDF